MSIKPGIYRNEGGINWSVFIEVTPEQTMHTHSWHNGRDALMVKEFNACAIGTARRPYVGEKPDLGNLVLETI